MSAPPLTDTTIETAEAAAAAASAPATSAPATAAPPTSAPPTPAEELDRVRAERDEYLDTLKRVQAEYDNYRRRVQREQADQVDRGGQQLAERLLEVLDAFDQAVQHGAPGTVEAVTPLRRALHDALAAAGLTRVVASDVAFDPAQHHAVAHDERPEPEATASEDAPATVVEVLRPGYRWHERLIRPALVKVRG